MDYSDNFLSVALFFTKKSTLFLTFTKLDYRKVKSKNFLITNYEKNILKNFIHQTFIISKNIKN